MQRLILLSDSRLLLVNRLALAGHSALQLRVACSKVVNTLVQLGDAHVLVVELLLQICNLLVLFVELRLVICNEFLDTLTVGRVVPGNLSFKLVDPGALFAKQFCQALKLSAHLRLVHLTLTTSHLLDETLLSRDAVKAYRHNIHEIGHLPDIFLMETIRSRKRVDGSLHFVCFTIMATHHTEGYKKP